MPGTAAAHIYQNAGNEFGYRAHRTGLKGLKYDGKMLEKKLICRHLAFLRSKEIEMLSHY